MKIYYIYTGVGGKLAYNTWRVKSSNVHNIQTSALEINKHY